MALVDGPASDAHLKFRRSRRRPQASSLALLGDRGPDAAAEKSRKTAARVSRCRAPRLSNTLAQQRGERARHVAIRGAPTIGREVLPTPNERLSAGEADDHRSSRKRGRRFGRRLVRHGQTTDGRTANSGRQADSVLTH
jgi:hypothetical protein